MNRGKLSLVFLGLSLTVLLVDLLLPSIYDGSGLLGPVVTFSLLALSLFLLLLFIAFRGRSF